MTVLSKIKWSLICVFIGFFPTWLYLLAKFVFRPSGFWENFTLAGAVLWFGGGLQLILFMVLIVVLFIIWSVLPTYKK